MVMADKEATIERRGTTKSPMADQIDYGTKRSHCNLEARYAIKIPVELGRNATETYEMSQLAYELISMR